MSIIVVLFNLIYELFHVVWPIHGPLTSWAATPIDVYGQLLTFLTEWEYQGEFTFFFPVEALPLKILLLLLCYFKRLFRFLLFFYVNTSSFYLWVKTLWIKVINLSMLSNSAFRWLIFNDLLAIAH